MVLSDSKSSYNEFTVLGSLRKQKIPSVQRNNNILPSRHITYFKHCFKVEKGPEKDAVSTLKRRLVSKGMKNAKIMYMNDEKTSSKEKC